MLNQGTPSAAGSGSFYCFVAKSPHLGAWLLSRTKSDRLVHEKLDSVLSSWEDEDLAVGSASNDATTPTSLARQASLPQTQSYVYKGAGLSVRLGLEEVAADLVRVKPYVYNAPDASAVVVFSGHLTNLTELSRRAASSADSNSGGSPARSGDVNNSGGGASLERKSSIERSLDLGATTAALVLSMYQAGQAEGNEVIMLSELQGEYALVIYDNKRKQAFAARDPSGEEPLFYHIADDGSVSFAGSRLAVPDGEQPHEWRELPPGHFISGKTPRLHQFALTPQQLAMRELQQEDEFGLSGDALEPPGVRRRSIGMDGGVFSLDL